MPRLIDANSLRRLFDTLSKNKWNKASFTSWAIAYEAAKSMVDDEVTVDAVPVVRCKYCKWRGEPGCAVRIVDESDRPKDDDFCSWGERRTDGPTD